MSKILFQKDYSDESLIDLESDICWLSEEADDIPKDEWGFRAGTFRVTIEWFPEELA